MSSFFFANNSTISTLLGRVCTPWFFPTQPNSESRPCDPWNTKKFREFMSAVPDNQVSSLSTNLHPKFRKFSCTMSNNLQRLGVSNPIDTIYFNCKICYLISSTQLLIKLSTFLKIMVILFNWAHIYHLWV